MYLWNRNHLRMCVIPNRCLYKKCCFEGTKKSYVLLILKGFPLKTVENEFYSMNIENSAINTQFEFTLFF